VFACLFVSLPHIRLKPKTNDPKVFKRTGITWDWDILEVTWFGVERSKVKVTRSTLHNDTTFRTTTALHPHSLGGETDKGNTARIRTL